MKAGKQYTVATWDAAGTALSGLGDALSTVGDTLGNTTRKVVEKKYGDDVTTTFLGGEAKTEVKAETEVKPSK